MRKKKFPWLEIVAVCLIFIGLPLLVQTLMSQTGVNNMPEHLASLTMEEALEDYDTFWENISRYHATLVTVPSERLDSLKETYREKIESLDPNKKGFAINFYQQMRNLMNDELDHIGHVTFTTPFYIKELVTFSSKGIEVLPDYSRLAEDPLAAETIEWLKISLKTNSVDYSDEEVQEENLPENVTFDSFDGDIGYMKLPSFKSRFIERDGRLLEEWMESHINDEYIIIDIRSNGGGSDLYWVDNILPYFIYEDVPITRYTFIKEWPDDPDCSLLERELQERLATEEDWDTVLALPEIQPEDVSGYSLHAIKGSQRGFPDRGFDGRVFVLTDRYVGSAAAGFADFCRISGMAQIVGDYTGGDAGSGIEPVMFTLPNTKLVYWHRIDYCLNPDGSCQVTNGLEPDVYAPDDTLEACLDIISKERR